MLANSNCPPQALGNANGASPRGCCRATRPLAVRRSKELVNGNRRGGLGTELRSRFVDATRSRRGTCSRAACRPRVGTSCSIDGLDLEGSTGDWRLEKCRAKMPELRRQGYEPMGATKICEAVVRMPRMLAVRGDVSRYGLVESSGYLDLRCRRGTLSPLSPLSPLRRNHFYGCPPRVPPPLPCVALRAPREGPEARAPAEVCLFGGAIGRSRLPIPTGIRSPAFRKRSCRGGADIAAGKPDRSLDDGSVLPCPLPAGPATLCCQGASSPADV